MALSKPGVCSDQAPDALPQPTHSPACLNPCRNTVPRPGMLPWGGDREHCGPAAGPLVKAFCIWKATFMPVFLAAALSAGSGHAESPAGTLPSRSQSPALIH